MDEAVKEVAEVVDAIKSGRIPPPNKAQTIVICEKVLELGVMLSEARCELKEAQSLLDRIGDALEDVDYKGDYADGVKALLLRSNVEFRRGEALACNAGLGAERPGKD